MACVRCCGLQEMHQLLFEMTTTRNPYLLRPDNSGMVQVMRVFSEILVCSGGGGGSDCIDMVSKELMWVPAPVFEWARTGVCRVCVHMCVCSFRPPRLVVRVAFNPCAGCVCMQGEHG
jgi:hypothetical protein